MTILKELAVVARKYTDKNGADKAVWQNIGAIHEHNGKEYITLNPLINLAAIPRKEGDDRVFVSLFEPKPKQGKQEPTESRANAPVAGEFDDDIPF